MRSPAVKQQDAFLGALATWSRTRIIASVFGAYAALVVLFGILYWAFDLTTGEGLLENMYFSLVTQATVGYGDVLPSGAGRIAAILQIVAGVIWIAFLPALVVIRLSSPHVDTIRMSRYLAFDPRKGQFRLKVVNTGRFVGSHTSVQPWLRVYRVGGQGRRALPVAIRSKLPYEIRFPHMRPMLATGFLTERADSPEVPAGVDLIRLHPAHFTADTTLIVDVSIETPFGTASRTDEYQHGQVLCGEHSDVQPIADGPQDWSKFDHVTTTTSTADGIAFCMSCEFRPTCRLVTKA